MGVLKMLVWTIYGRRREEADTAGPENSAAGRLRVRQGWTGDWRGCQTKANARLTA